MAERPWLPRVRALVPVPLPLYCRHGITVAWRYRDDENRIDTRLAGWCPTCGPVTASGENAADQRGTR